MTIKMCKELKGCKRTDPCACQLKGETISMNNILRLVCISVLVSLPSMGEVMGSTSGTKKKKKKKMRLIHLFLSEHLIVNMFIAKMARSCLYYVSITKIQVLPAERT